MLSQPSLDARSVMGAVHLGVPLGFWQKAFSRGTKPKASKYEVGAVLQIPTSWGRPR